MCGAIGALAPQVLTHLLAATGTASSLPLGGLGDPLRLQRGHVGVGVVALLLVAAAVDDAHDVVYGDSLRPRTASLSHAMAVANVCGLQLSRGTFCDSTRGSKAPLGPFRCTQGTAPLQWLTVLAKGLGAVGAQRCLVGSR